MFKISIKGTTKAAEAITWCKNNINKDNWNVRPEWPNVGWTFSFDHSKDASWFGLKWVN